MIFDGLVTWTLSMVTAALGLLPDPGPLSLGSMDGLFTVVRAVNQVAPVTETFAAAGVYMGAVAFVAGFAVIRTLLRFLPSWITGGG